MNKKFALILLLIIVLSGLLVLLFIVVKDKNSNGSPKQEETTDSPTTTNLKSYQTAAGFTPSTEIFNSDIEQVTRMEITPDGEIMLAATLPGDIFVFTKKAGVFVKQETKFFSVATNLKGYPVQNGLTGLSFSADFSTSKEIFLSYTALNEKNELKNRVGRITLKNTDGIITGENFEVIFEGNVNATSAHQIQGGTGVMIKGKSHFLFPIGDAFDADNAHNLAKDAGKIFLIQRDGSAPIGQRPYPETPKVQAVGIRNVYDIELAPYDKQLRYMFVDTGNNDNDKLIFGKLLSTDGVNDKQMDFRWTGSDDNQKLGIRDLYTTSQPNMNLFQWSPTQTPLDIKFINFEPGSVVVPKDNESYFLLTVFGQTSSTKNSPGKKILFGKLKNLNTQPEVEFTDFVIKNSDAEGFLGNPTSLTVDPITKAVYFSDIMEGRIYKVE